MHDEIGFRLTKKMILIKLMVDEVWIKFELNEALYDDRSRINRIPYNIETIKMILFGFKEQLITFQYSGNSFDVNSSSDRDFSEAEAEIRYKIGLVEDVDFVGFDDRKIFK
jgi:hypothetical protein